MVEEICNLHYFIDDLNLGYSNDNDILFSFGFIFHFGFTDIERFQTTLVAL